MYNYTFNCPKWIQSMYQQKHACLHSNGAWRALRTDNSTPTSPNKEWQGTALTPNYCLHAFLRLPHFHTPELLQMRILYLRFQITINSERALTNSRDMQIYSQLIKTSERPSYAVGTPWSDHTHTWQLLARPYLHA